MNIVVLIQSRVSSERFPNKVLERIENKPLFEYLHDRLLNAKLINKIAYVIPSNKKNYSFYKKIKKKITMFLGVVKKMFLIDILNLRIFLKQI